MALVRITLPPKLSRYIDYGDELLEILREMYGINTRWGFSDYHFGIAVRETAQSICALSLSLSTCYVQAATCGGPG